MADALQGWLDSSLLVKLHFLILFGVAMVTLVRAARIGWAFSRRRRRHTAAILVRSTRGLAGASLLLSGGGAAAALGDALILFGTTGRSPADTLIEQHRGAFALIAVSLGLCAFLYAAGILLERLHDAWPPLEGDRHETAAHDFEQQPTRLAANVAMASRLVRLAAVILVCIAVARVGVDVRAMAPQPPRGIGAAAYLSVELLWSRLSIALFTCAVLSWAFVLLDSAVARRRASEAGS